MDSDLYSDIERWTEMFHPHSTLWNGVTKVMPIMRFLQFAKLKTELGTQPGLTIQMMTLN